MNIIPVYIILAVLNFVPVPLPVRMIFPLAWLTLCAMYKKQWVLTAFHLFVHPLHHSVLRIMIPYYAGQLFLFWGGQKLLRNTRQGRDEAVCR